MAGETLSYGAGQYDFWLVKTDSAGNQLWAKTYGGTGYDVAFAVVQTIDGGYAIAGSTNSFGAGGDFWLVKTDSAGNQLWNKTYGGAGGDITRTLVQTSDGGYAMAGWTNGSYGIGDEDLWLVKTDSSGNQLWNKTYGGAGGDYPHSIIQTSDGGFAIAGHTNSYGAGGEDFWLVKTDSAGNMQWTKTFGTTSYEEAWSLVQTTDGGYALAGTINLYSAGGLDFWLVKTDVESGLAWTDSTVNTITLYRGATDIYWNYVRVRLWKTG
jgi:hypothetical protein